MLDDIKIARSYVGKQQNAENRGKPFTLTFNQHKKLKNAKRCHYTNVKLHEGNYSIDCIDPKLGYTKENAVACDKRLNERKGDLTPLEIKQLYWGLNHG